MLHQALGIMQQPRSMKVDGSGAERAYMLHAQMFTSPSWLRKLLPTLQLLRVAPWTVPHPVTVATLLGCDFPAWGNERVLICTPKSASDSPPRLDCRTRVLVQCLQKHAQLRFGKIICFADRAVHASDDSYISRVGPVLSRCTPRPFLHRAYGAPPCLDLFSSSFPFYPAEGSSPPPPHSPACATTTYAPSL